MAKANCSIDGCDKPVRARGWCATHHHRWRVNGDPNVVRGPNGGETRRFVEAALHSATDDCVLWGFAKSYPHVRLNGKLERAHCVVCRQVHGEPPSPEHEVAHNCGDRRCINPRHLRWATHQENMDDCVAHGTWIARNQSPGYRNRRKRS